MTRDINHRLKETWSDVKRFFSQLPLTFIFQSTHFSVIFSALIILRCYFSLWKTNRAEGFNRFCPCHIGRLLTGTFLIRSPGCGSFFLWEEPALKRICTFFLYSVPHKCKLRRKHHPISLFHGWRVTTTIIIRPSCSCTRLLFLFLYIMSTKNEDHIYKEIQAQFLMLLFRTQRYFDPRKGARFFSG